MTVVRAYTCNLSYFVSLFYTHPKRTLLQSLPTTGNNGSMAEVYSKLKMTWSIF